MAISKSSLNSLDLLLPPSRCLPFHRALRDASFFIAIKPEDGSTRTRQFRRWKAFQIAFMSSLCLRLIVECFTSTGSPLLLYLGDFKVWWGEPYTINQTIWLAAAIVVPCYQFINLRTLCSKDTRWALPFQFVEGLKTARQIRLEDERQMSSLLFKMKVNFYRAIVLQYTVIISYTTAVFISYLVFYESYLYTFTLGIFWTAYECHWTRYIAGNMGLYSGVFEIIAHYLSLRFNKAQEKLADINEQLRSKRYPSLRTSLRITALLSEVNEINSDMRHYNHYWRKYMLAVFTSYVPQILFELYACLYLSMTTSVFTFSITLSVNMVFLVSQLCIFSAGVIHKAYAVRSELYSCCAHLARECHDKLALRQLLKMSFFVEQYNFKQSGFYLMDNYLMDWNFYYSTVVNCTIYFLLLTDILQAPYRNAQI